MFGVGPKRTGQMGGLPMSYYYNYYLCYKDSASGKLLPLGPFNKKGHLLPVYEVSRSFASDLCYDFSCIDKELFSQELKDALCIDEYEGFGKISSIPLTNLRKGSFIKSGFFLIDDVIRYQQGSNVSDLFYDYISPEVYAAKINNELIFGKPDPKKDIEGDEVEVPSGSDYMYFAYPDYQSAEYEASRIRDAYDIVWDFKIEDKDCVILLLEG